MKDKKDQKNKKGKVIVLTDKFNQSKPDKTPLLYDQLEQELKDIEEMIAKNLESKD